VSRHPAQSDAGRRAAGHAFEALLEVSLVSTLPMPRMFPALSMHHEQSLQAPGAAMLWDTRRRRGVDAPNPSPCIEIAHPRSGARFLLSRENGVWLLSFHAASATGSVDLQSFVATLRTHFARQGLGPIDIIVDDSVNQT
jgi:hypothetical protein